MPSNKKYKALLLDFDRTLWDTEKNQKDAIRNIYDKYEIAGACADFELFYGLYMEMNDKLWLDYRDGKVSREYLRNYRFIALLERIGIKNDKLAIEVSNEYINTAPYFRATIPYARETVEYLAGRYPLYIVTNGFNEVQHLKLRNCGLEGYFREIITSEDAGANKPHRPIFDYTLKKAGVSAAEALMIGDDIENDIIGAQRAGINTVYFNRYGVAHGINPEYEIRSLAELRDIL